MSKFISEPIKNQKVLEKKHKPLEKTCGRKPNIAQSRKVQKKLKTITHVTNNMRQ